MDKVEKLMKKLDISKEDAEKLIIYDKMVDQNKPTPYDLTKEQQKIAKNYTKSGTKTVKSAKTEWKKAKDDEKSLIIEEIYTFLAENPSILAQNVEKVNAERQISFKIGENSYSLTLTKHRK